MRKGLVVDEEEISAYKLGITVPYLMDVYRNLFDDGYLTGSYVRDDYSGDSAINDIQGVRITTKGVEYLQDNSKMKKVYKLLKEAKDWVSIISFI